MVIVDISKFDQYRLYLLENKIKLDKPQYDEQIYKEHLLKGWRYHDDKRIAKIVIGNIFEESGYDYEKAAQKFLSLNSTEIEPYIKNAVLDSAHSDYWYTYEKVW